MSIKEFSMTPEGYLQAKAYLKGIGKWDYISTHGLSTDGYSIVHEANSILKKQTYES